MEVRAEKFINLMSLEGFLQKYIVIKNSLIRNKEILETITKERPSVREIRNNILLRPCTYHDVETSCKKMITFSISKDIENFDIISDNIKKYCHILSINYKELLKSCTIPYIEDLRNYPPYLIHRNTLTKKRSCRDAFGKKYCLQTSSLYI